MPSLLRFDTDTTATAIITHDYYRYTALYTTTHCTAKHYKFSLSILNALFFLLQLIILPQQQVNNPTKMIFLLTQYFYYYISAAYYTRYNSPK